MIVMVSVVVGVVGDSVLLLVLLLLCCVVLCFVVAVSRLLVGVPKSIQIGVQINQKSTQHRPNRD